MQAFIDDFRCQKAEGLLKKLYKCATDLDRPGDPLLTQSSEALGGDVWTQSETPRPTSARKDLDKLFVNKAVFTASCSVLERVLRLSSDSYIDDQPNHEDEVGGQPYLDGAVISDLEWEIISCYDIFESSASQIKLPTQAPEGIDAFLKGKDDDGKPSAARQREAQRKQRIDEKSREEAALSINVQTPLGKSGLSRVHTILSQLSILEPSQSVLNGKGDISKNLWIVKPAAKSRGRGISTFRDLPKLLKYVEAGNGLSTQWVVQKYMELPLTIANRKFDLRQWVLVTDWNPLTIYFYDECYARFSVEEYTTSDDNLDDAYVHLVNNSIGKNSDNFNKVVTAENGETIEGFMWGCESFRRFVKEKSGYDAFKEKIQPRMKDIAKWSLMCASECIEHRKNSWELYGFDFMVDEDFNAWLIEINSSPACDYSTKVTERYVQKALVELLSVVLDVRQWEATPKKNRGVKPETGGWENIYKGPILEMPVSSFGTDLTLKGDALRPPKRPVPPYVPSNQFAQSLLKPQAHQDQQQQQPNETSSSVHSQKMQNPKPPPYFPRSAVAAPQKRTATTVVSGLKTAFGNAVATQTNTAATMLIYNDSDDDLSIGNENVAVQLPPTAPALPSALQKKRTSFVQRPISQERKVNAVTTTQDKGKQALPVKVFSPDF